MDSIRHLYRIGVGPSSSHTMGPRRAAEVFLQRHPAAARYRVVLFASLAATGKGHLTDKALTEAFSPRSLEIVWREDESLAAHPNGMRFEALDSDGVLQESWEVYSVGGGEIRERDEKVAPRTLYPLTRLKEILDLCDARRMALWNYVEECEGGAVWDFLDTVWKTMQDAVRKGLTTRGVLPGRLGVPRKAASLLASAQGKEGDLQRDGLLAAYAYAVAEENAAAGTIVTAPTCGSCGVLPAVLSFFDQTAHSSPRNILEALAIAGLIGNIVKEHASISGAEVGCQGEVGTACAMAAGAAAHLMGGSNRQIEYAAEMGLEHHLGLTCDPIDGLVQIPCIERNAHAAIRALTCCHLALLSDGTHAISFDEVAAVMKETGQDLLPSYRETATGGLAKAHRSKERRDASPPSPSDEGC